MSETSIMIATADISGDVISTPSELNTQVMIDTGDGLQRAVAVKKIEGDLVSDASVTDVECVVDVNGDLQRAIKVHDLGSGGGGGDDGLKQYASMTTDILFTSDYGWDSSITIGETTYTASFTLENDEEDWMLVASPIVANDEEVGDAVPCGVITFDNGGMTSPFELGILSKDENSLVWTGTVGDYTYSFSIEVDEEDPSNQMLVDGYVYKDEEQVGTCSLYWRMDMFA